MTTPTPNARSGLVESLVAALKAESVTWPRLVQLGQAAAPELAACSAPAIALPEGHRRAIAGLLPQSPAEDPAAARSLRRVMILLVEMCAYGVAEALALCTEEADAFPDAAHLLGVMGRFVDEARIARGFSEPQLRRIEAERLKAPPRRYDILLSALRLLGLSGRASAEDRERAFACVVLARMRRAAEANEADALLAIEMEVYSSYIKTTETPEHHTRAFAAIEAAYAALPRRPPAAAFPRQAIAPRVVFVIPNGHVLAHSEVLLAFLSGLKSLDMPAIAPHVLIYMAHDGGELGRRLDQLGVPWSVAGVVRDSRFDAHFEAVNGQIAALSADSVVFVSVPQFLAYFMRRPLAPIQIWWSMKFALPNFADLDGRVFYRSLFDRQIEIAGRVWRGGPLAFTPPPPPNPDKVLAIRAQYSGRVILGTIAREEKIANAEYLEAVVEVLRRHPEAVFLWTGRSQPRQVTEAFEAGGVGDRCRFIGWVDPAPYIAAFDLFIETYPLTGLMSGWSMALGKPIASVGSLGFLATYLEPVLDGSISADPADLDRLADIFRPVADALPNLWVPHPRDLPAFVDRLLTSPQLLARLGQVQQHYVEAFMLDEEASAAIQARHFATIIDAARAA